MQSVSAIQRLTTGLAEHGVDLTPWQPSFLLRRLQRAAMLSGDVFLDRHVERLLAEPACRAEFLRELSIGVSEFFRDALPFASLEEELLPELARLTHFPRALSIGCAQGQEAWSLAILLAERFEHFHVLAVDRHPGLIDRALHARYSRDELSRVSLGRVERWFVPEENGSFHVHPDLSTHVRFELQELSDGSLPAHLEPGAVHLVLCRNVFIYLSAHARSALLDSVAAALCKGGFLMLGAADQLPPHPAFSAVEGRPGFFRREAI